MGPYLYLSPLKYQDFACGIARTYEGVIRTILLSTIVMHWWNCSILNQRSHFQVLTTEKIVLRAPPPNGPAERNPNQVEAPICKLQTLGGKNKKKRIGNWEWFLVGKQIREM